MRVWGKLFLITLFFVSAAAGLFWLDAFRGYEADMRILVVGKSQTAGAERAAGSLAALIETLPFYDRLIVDDLTDDPFEGLSQDKRRAAWNDVVSAKQDVASGIIVVTAKGSDPDEARVLARKTTQTLSSLAGIYYNVKTDIDIRIVEGPITRTVIVHPVAFVLTTFVSAFAATAMFFFVLIVLPRLFGSRQSASSVEYRDMTSVAGTHAYDIGDAVAYIDPSKFVPTKPSSLPFEPSHLETITPSVKAAAPNNLPVADDALDLPVSDEPLPFSFEGVDLAEYPVADLPFRGEHEIEREAAADEDAMMKEESFSSREIESSEPVSLNQEEPTVEEYKRRLNELLSGGR
jgi:capsular polysaccharide biosynthesis protein